MGDIRRAVKSKRTGIQVSRKVVQYNGIPSAVANELRELRRTIVRTNFVIRRAEDPSPVVNALRGVEAAAKSLEASIRAERPRSGRRAATPHPRSIVVATSHVLGATPGQLEAHWQTVRDLLNLAGIAILVEGVERRGSVWKSWAIRRAKRNAKRLAEAVALATQDSYIRKPGAEATSQLAQAVSALLDSAGDLECIHHFDNIVIGQFRGIDGQMKRFSKELSVEERRAVDSDQTLLAEPGAFLGKLAGAIRERVIEA